MSAFPTKIDIFRAVELMRLASNMIREECPEAEAAYDEVVCDGACLADDLWNLAEDFEQGMPA